MRIGRNPFAIHVYKGVQQSAAALHTSMSRLSSGERISRPGDAPADFGISEMLRYQIRNGSEAKRNIENARFTIDTADSWLQTTQDILARMSELAVSASDGSKSLGDRENLNAEYEQLKDEVSRIARQAKYNGLQVAGTDQMITYDEDKETFFMSQLDGGERYSLPVKVMSGLQSDNNQNFMFDSSKAFTQSADGQYIFYADSADNLVKYDIEEGGLYRDTTDTEDKAFEVDDEGRMWYATETAAGSGTYQLKQQDIESWTQDTTLINTGDIADMASTEFRVYDGRVYYYDTNNDVVSRSLRNTSDTRIELASTDLAFTATAGQFSLSHDGLYMADVPVAGTMRVTNMETKQSQSFAVGAGITIDNVTFSSDSTEVFYRDSVEGAIHRITMKGGDNPSLADDVKLHAPSGATGFSGLSVDGGSHRSFFRVHNGPDAVQESIFTTGDVRLISLGLSRTSVATLSEAQHALGKLQSAIDNVSVQRARLGAEASRIDHTYEALINYTDNIMQADAVLRETDVVKESTDLAEFQVRHQAAIAIMAQANQVPQNALRLLQA